MDEEKLLGEMAARGYCEEVHLETTGFYSGASSVTLWAHMQRPDDLIVTVRLKNGMVERYWPKRYELVRQ